MKKLRTFIGILLCLTGGAANAKAYEHYHSIFPPFLDEHGLGAAQVTARMVYEYAGLNVELIPAPYARVLKLAQGDKVLFFSYGNIREKVQNNSKLMSPTPHKTPLMTTLTNLFGEPPSTDFTSLNGKRIVKLRGYPWNPIQDIISNKNHRIVTYEVNNLSQGFALLKLNRVDYFLSYEILIKEFVKNHPEYQTQQSTVILPVDGIAIAVNTTHPHFDLVFPKLEKAYLKLFEEEKLDPETAMLKSFSFEAYSKQRAKIQEINSKNEQPFEQLLKLPAE